MIDSLSIRSTDSFVLRHIGPRPAEIREMLEFLKLDSLAELIDQTIPAGIRPKSKLSLPACGSGRTEGEALADLRALAARNQVFKSFIGMGYSDCFTPPVLQRNLLENPGWYTPYTPYQSEISQGRLEALLNFQTMVADLTGMEIANASLLDEGTAAAEAMSMCLAISGGEGRAFFVSERCHPTTIAIVEARAEPRGIEVIVGDHRGFSFDRPIFGALLQYPATDGAIYDYTDFIEKAHHAGALAVVAADILALALLKPPGEMDADIVVGNTQRFGVPLGYGGPHAAYLATRDRFRRQIPGRIVGVSRDTDGRPGLRLALQTREQHIRRDRATSNICTAQVLLAVVASMYAVYHGPEGIREIAERTHRNAATLCAGLRRLGHQLGQDPFFDTLTIPVTNDRRDEIAARARAKQMNLRVLDGALGISLDETSTIQDLDDLLQLFAPGGASSADAAKLEKGVDTAFPANLARKSGFLTHPVFSRYRSETEFMRYLNRLREKDVSLANSMIPLGSCTMKLNAAVEMAPVTWPEFGRMHPFAPLDQAEGYHELRRRLETMLAEITGFDAVSLQPNAGSQGEYAGLLVIRKFHHDRGEQQRNVCLIPESAHGTNPASAAMAGMKIVVIVCDEHGNIDVEDLRQRAEEHRNTLAALMVTYPSTHGVFEERITEICDIVHRCGGQVYMDGANMNAQVGICRPGDFGADVCHLNLHKTFCIPHGGGGPGMGPIGVQAHLAPYLPTHAVIPTGGDRAIGEIASAP
ncbi:MAG TPA: aminomethyl-transferring glycine dehydrogenase, partial [Armatimonadota bacterium]|nr:aminomethyl-transferring glycine dehydrogenase [Armatimonadota bacterium]